MTRRWFRTETVFKIVLVAFLLMLMWMARDYPDKSRLFPMIILGITILMTSWTLLQDILKLEKGTGKRGNKKAKASSRIPEEQMRLIKGLEEQEEKDAGLEPLEERLARKRYRQSAAIILISLGIGYLGGFLLTVPFYFMAFGLLHGKREHTPRYITIAVGITMVIYFFFSHLMGVPLLRGLLWG
jgi:hypothetical protein